MGGIKYGSLAKEAAAKLITVANPTVTRSKKEPRGSGKRKVKRESEASLWSQLVFSWYTSLVKKGAKKEIEVEDLFHLDDVMRINHLAERWQHVQRGQQRRGNFCLWKLILVTFRVEIFVSIIGKIIFDLSQTSSPIFIGLLVSYSEEADAGFLHGFLLVAAFFLALSIRSLVMNWYFKIIAKLGLRLKSCMMAAIYDKMLRMSICTQKQRSEGKILNHAANDSEKIKGVVENIPQFLGVPFMTCLNLFILWRTVGPTACLGLLIPLLIGPFNVLASERRRAFQKRQLKLKDERLKKTSEVFSGIKVVKLLAWEDAMWQAIDSLHSAETALYKRGSFIKMTVSVVNQASPFMASVMIFSFLTLFTDDFEMTPKIAFVSLTLFEQISKWPLLIAADLLQSTSQGSVSYKRLCKFFAMDETIPKNRSANLPWKKDLRSEDCEYSVSVNGASFAWESTASPIIEDVTLKIKPGELMVLTGAVGSGKSSLLNALQGELRQREGICRVNGRIAFVPQQPWILNATVKDNIIMDKAFEATRYLQVIKACALEPDLALMQAGDLTVIGEKGCSLSGGQRARIGLARAVYQDRSIYLFDDPLAAVDAQVANKIFNDVIGPNGMLSAKARILVTHGGTFQLDHADHVATFFEGRLVPVSNMRELQEQNFTLRERSPSSSPASTPSPSQFSPIQLSPIGSCSPLGSPTPFRIDGRQTQRKRQNGGSVKIEIEPTTEDLLLEAASSLKASSPFNQYVHRMGIYRHFVPALIMLVITALLSISKGLWIKEWSQHSPCFLGEAFDSNERRLAGYAIIGFAELLSLWFAVSLFIHGGCQATRSFHCELLKNLMRYPLPFYHETSVGTVTNIFGKEFDVIDGLWGDLQKLGESAISISKTVILIGYLSPPVVLLLVPIFFVYKNFTKSFIATITKLLKMESMQRAQMFALFSECYEGVVSIRTHNWTQFFKNKAAQRIDTKIRASFNARMAYRWLAVRVEALGNVIILAAGSLAVVSRGVGWLAAGSMAFVFSNSLDFSTTLNSLVRQYANILKCLQSVMRIREFSTHQQELNHRCDLDLGDWPWEGRVKYHNFCLKYKEDDDYAISNLNVDIAPGEKIGVVGRTGAGKSSLALSLFRMLEPCAGSLTIDDIDVCEVGLYDLREALTIIPQEPVLFSGDLRFNLDPTKSFSDDELRDALENANLLSLVDANGGFDFKIEEGGRNLSAGQRQLVCLARALLRKSRILVLDEATAAVDTYTDSLIQATIRREFETSTVITIAHRINTIMDYDRIMVMDKGRLVECGTPQQLLSDQNSRFATLARHARIE